MNMWKFGFLSSFLLLFMACGDQQGKKNFKIELDGGGKKFTLGQEVSAKVKSRSKIPPDSVAYFLEGKALSLNQGKISLEASRPGTHLLQATIYAENEEFTSEKEILLLALKAPELYTYEVINTYPHDIQAFTQGLEFLGDTLYETTGQKGASSLRKVDYRTGEILQKTDLDSRYFGEGLTILGDSLYMLTWQSKTGFIFDPESLERLGSFSYGESREGWGLCNDGTQIFKSDGSAKIWTLDPRTLKETGYIETVTNTSIFNKANELEYVDGKIYANVWQKASMMIIDAESGVIEGVVNFGGLRDKVTQHPALDVFNGVAYHRERGTFFVTGKRWDRMFEVRIFKKPAQ